MKAQKKAEREAEMLAARAMTELANKRKCHELEQVTRNQQSQASELTTASTKLKQNSLHNDVTPGSYVHVSPDLLSPGKCSFGGNGFVTAVDGDSIRRMFTVKYDKCGSTGTETGISYGRLTVVPSPFASARLVRKRQSPELLTNGVESWKPKKREQN